jgi:hypothetical protein
MGEGGCTTFLLVMGKNFNFSASKIAAFTLMKMAQFLVRAENLQLRSLCWQNQALIDSRFRGVGIVGACNRKIYSNTLGRHY